MTYLKENLMDDSDIMDLYVTLSKIITPNLKRFKELNKIDGSIPNTIFQKYEDEDDEEKEEKAQKEWMDTLDKMIYAFDQIVDRGQ